MSSGLCALEDFAQDVVLWEIKEDEFGERQPLPCRPPRQLLQRGVPIIEASRGQEGLRAEFAILAAEVEAAAAIVSATRRLARHPAYAGILALGDDAIPLLLERLKESRSRPVLLRLLGSLTAFQPGAGQETVEEAAAEWVRWGKKEGRVV